MNINILLLILFILRTPLFIYILFILPENLQYQFGLDIANACDYSLTLFSIIVLYQKYNYNEDIGKYELYIIYISHFILLGIILLFLENNYYMIIYYFIHLIAIFYEMMLYFNYFNIDREITLSSA
jgi:hypothetical protein